MTEGFSFKRFIFSLLFGLGGAVLAYITPLLLPPAIAAIGFAGVCWGSGYALAAGMLVIVGVCVSQMGQMIPLIAVSLFVALSSVVLIVGLRRKRPYRLIAAILALLALAALYVSNGVPAILEGAEPYRGIVNGINSFAALSEQMGVDASEIRAISGMVPTVYYGILILLAEAAGFSELMLARAFAGKKRDQLRPMARFAEWQLPPSLRIGLPILAAGLIVMYLAKFGGTGVMLVTIAYMLLPVFGAVGLACLLYMKRWGSGGKGLFTALAILITVMTPYFTALLGVVDLYAGIRRKFMKADKLIREAFEKAEREKSNTVTVDFGDGRGPQIIAVRKRAPEDAFFDSAPDKKEEADEKSEEKEQKTPEGNEGQDAGAEEDAPDARGDDNDGGEVK